VNNAGILMQAVIGMIAIDPVKQMLDVNLVAMINLTQYAVRLMANSASPSIINLASIAGLRELKESRLIQLAKQLWLDLLYRRQKNLHQEESE